MHHRLVYKCTYKSIIIKRLYSLVDKLVLSYLNLQYIEQLKTNLKQIGHQNNVPQQTLTYK